MKSLKDIRIPNINAVLFKDLQQKTKKTRLAFDVFIVNLFLTFIAVIVLFSASVSAATFTAIDYSIFSTFFIVIGFLEFGIVIIVTPAITAGAITSEREKQTFDVLLSTALTTKQIIWGKYWASILQIMLMILSGFPVYALVFIYGGVSFFQAFAVILTLLLITMYVAALGIFWSSVSKKSILATVLTYVSLIGLMFGTISIVVTFYGITAAINSLVEESTNVSPNLSGDFSVFLFLLNPLCTICDCITNVFGIRLFSSSSGMRGLLESITNFSSNNIILVFWTPISLVIQMLLSWWLLSASARIIDPLRKKADKRGKKKQRNK